MDQIVPQLSQPHTLGWALVTRVRTQLLAGQPHMLERGPALHTRSSPQIDPTPLIQPLGPKGCVTYIRVLF